MINIQQQWLTAKDQHLISIDSKPYYDGLEDVKKREEYYRDCNINKACDLQELLAGTHSIHLNYAPHQYVYPWVDLQENLELKSLYSGHQINPLKVIEQDLRLHQKLQEGILSVNESLVYNCEHVVPQSWFNGYEPMRGDLHHLFACEPSCNRLRSNYSYFDFQSYAPEPRINTIKTGCGMAEDQKFEPEYGKGIVARAVFYFSIRYKDVIDLTDKFDFELLLCWHKEHPVTLYESHRNAAIQELQGNRNPFIDFPDAAKKMLGIRDRL